MPDLAAALPGAVARGEIAAWFQPQIDISTGATVGAEALARWTHPEFGEVPPADFIPLAEESGEIDEIGRFMAEESFAAVEHWSSLVPPLDVSVNVSPIQLVTSTFTDWLAERLARLGTRRGVLTIEITESRPLENVAALVHRLNDLRAAGLGIAIDDFGVGQSSLVQLKRVHGTELKIDRSLVIDASEATTRLLRRAITAAHDLGIRVVAEGVETYAHLQRMRELECDRAQGYLIGKAMPRRAFDALLGAT
jgi:EAL domain-containing protein (putative c-di-GMP-specific phosphodiesterase class I)